jgi:hypothetical protein
MKVLNLYFSATGNTKKVAQTITATAEACGCRVDTIRATENAEVNLLHYDLIFIGSGVYEWLPGKPLRSLLSKLRQEYVAQREIQPASPLRQGKIGVVYCTYGGDVSRFFFLPYRYQIVQQDKLCQKCIYKIIIENNQLIHNRRIHSS